MIGNPLLLFLAVFPIVGGIMSYIVGRYNKRYRDYFAILVTIVEFLVMISFINNMESFFQWKGFAGSRMYLTLDGFRLVYGIIAAFMWLMTTIFSREYFKSYRNRNRYYMFMLMTLGGTMGVLFSGDLITTFIFFEIMSFTSYVMVIHDEKKKSQDAANTYMAVAVIGGLVMLMGIFLIQYYLGTTDINAIGNIMKDYSGNRRPIYLASILMMVGFGGKAGMFPIHIWLPNAHPAAPAPASALLSGILTKTGIFGAAVISSNIFLHDELWGIGILIIGGITMFLGAFLALFSIDLKRTLAYSSVSQIGFILIGIGMQGVLGSHNAIAVRGTILHMVNHSLIKLILFMAAGVIYMNLHELNLNKIRGFGKGKPLLTFIFAMGYLSIIGMPFWSGYISKTLLHESIIEKIIMVDNNMFYKFIESLFTLTGGFTAAYMTKLFVAVFIEKNPYYQEKNNSFNGKYMNKLSGFALLIPAVLLPVLGVFPRIMDYIGETGQSFFKGHSPSHQVHYFAWVNLKGAIISLFIGIVVYFLIIRKFLIKKDKNGNLEYINPWPKSIDIEENLYKPLLLNILPNIGFFFANIISNIPSIIGKVIYKGFIYLKVIYENLINFKKWIKNKYKYIYKEGKIEKINILVGSTLAFTLAQFAGGLLIILIVVLMAMN